MTRLMPMSAHRAPPRTTTSPAFGWESLTDTEQRVIGLVALGLTNRQAGERLCMSRHTVDFHLRAIFRKLDVRTRVALTRLAITHDQGGSERA